MAVITPAKTHPDVLIAAVAARDETKAKAYAKKHDIPVVHTSYEALLEDPSIDAVYIALPNGLHYKWTIKSLEAGKHVLLEKPSTSNHTEASQLFAHVALDPPNGKKPLVLLEAFHYRFHPAWQKFLTLLSPAKITHARSVQYLFKGFFSNDDIRFNFSLAGGTLMDFGTYNVSSLRQVFGAEPKECTSASARLMPKGWDQNIDQAMSASWRFPNGGIGEIEADLSSQGRYESLPWLTSRFPTFKLPRITVTHDEEEVEDKAAAQQSQKHFRARTATMWMYLAPHAYHRIDVADVHTLRDKDGKEVKKWDTTEYLKVYTQEGSNEPWSTYRHQLEEFVNRIRGREGSGVWITPEDSIKQMVMIDQAYLKAGLPIRVGVCGDS
jgi:predicted dehydrogenase